MKILIPGGAGYVGSKLVPELLSKGHEVTVYDLYLYGEDIFDQFKTNPALTQVKGDIRDIPWLTQALKGCDAVIHLACISNDPSFELDPHLGKSINFDCFEPFVKACNAAKVKRFIYASSSSVYGVKESHDVTEEMPLEPLTDYSKFKAACEKVLFESSSKEMCITVLRPATVCGYAPRQRLDVVVNILTNIAYHKKKIQVMGGDQMRPNIHIDDMVAAYLQVLNTNVSLVDRKIFNVGFHNHSVLTLGKMVAAKVGNVAVEIVPTNDPRSYHISSGKIEREIGFRPRKTIEDAIDSLLEAFNAGKLPNSLTDPRYFNIQTMKKVQLQ